MNLAVKSANSIDNSLEQELLLKALVASEGSSAVKRSFIAEINEQKCLDRNQEYSACYKLSPITEIQRASALSKLHGLNQLGIKVLVYGSKFYPPYLAAIDDPAILIYAKGDIGALRADRTRIAIVGARNGDRQGCDLARELAYQLAKRGALIVSGLALGIDTAAHRGALDSELSGSTVAVLGNGLNSIYPRQNERISGEILEQGGVLLSQFAPGVPPYPGNFLDRNRIISGLSDGVLIVQAQKRSGSLATARYALEQGREVFAVPGFPTDPRAEGTNNLIKQGAGIVCGLEDLLEHFPALTRDRNMHLSNTSIEQNSGDNHATQLLLTIITEQTKISYERLVASSKLGDKADQLILELELAGRIRRLPGDFVTIS